MQTTIEQIVQKAKEFDSLKLDYTDSKYHEMKSVIKGVNFEVTLGGKIAVITTDGKETVYSWTDHALQQICKAFGPQLFGVGSTKSLPFDFFKEALTYEYDPEVIANTSLVLGHFFGRKSGLLRTYKDTARAFLSDKYAIINNYDVISISANALEKYASRYGLSSTKDVVIPRQYLTPDSMSIDFIMHTKGTSDDGDYGIGFGLTNNEIGTGAWTFVPLIKRHACNNSIRAVSIAKRIIHKGSSNALMFQCALNIGEAMKMANDMVDAMIEASNIEIPDFSKMLTGVIDKNKIEETVANKIRDNVTKRTLGGMVNTITYVAHSCGLSQDAQDFLECLGGELLVNPTKHLAKTPQLVAFEQNISL